MKRRSFGRGNSRENEKPVTQSDGHHQFDIQMDEIIPLKWQDTRWFWRDLRNLPGVRDWRVLSDTIFMLTSFPLGIAWFIVLVVGGTVGGALSWLGVGLLIWAWTIAILMWGAQIERARLRVFLNVEISDPLQWSDLRGNVAQKSWSYLRLPHVWRDAVYVLLLFPIGIIELSLVLIPFGFLMAPMTVPVMGRAVHNGWVVDTPFEALLSFIIGVILIVPFAFLINLAARLHGQFGMLMLGSSREEELSERVEVLTESRSAVMRAMHLERRRIERDLHDGVQQELVNLAMDLGRARDRMDTDPEGAREIIARAHEESKEVLTEMRELVRGIHPAVLTDRGLDAAISAIAGRMQIPVEVDVELSRRQPEEVEGTAYFVVSESLTNITKHSAATRARVHIAMRAGWLRITVTDNGRGGADPEQGTGMKGLRERIAALEGTFEFDSPVGEGTRIIVEIPCE